MEKGDRFDYLEFVEMVEIHGSRWRDKGLFKCHCGHKKCKLDVVRIIESVERARQDPKSCGVRSFRRERKLFTIKDLMADPRNKITMTAWR